MKRLIRSAITNEGWIIEAMYGDMTEADWNDMQEEDAQSVDTAIAGDGLETDRCPDGRPCYGYCRTGHGCPSEVVGADVDAPAPAARRKTEEKTARPNKPSGAMTARQYHAACKKLGISIYASAKVLGVSLSTAQRYGGGKWAIPETVAKLLRALVALGRTDV